MNASQLINQTSGDVEWKPVEGFPHYEVSRDGRIRSLWFQEPRIIHGIQDRDGYTKLVLTGEAREKKTLKLASLIARAFHGPRPPGKVVAHDNGICSDDRADNLVYKTQLENIQDKWKHGTMMSGESHHAHKVTAEQVLEIRESKDTLAVLGSEYGISKASVSAIRTGRTWNASQLINQDSGSDDYWTPQPILDAARATMGGIDLDPASCFEANKRVNATRFLSEKGLENPWMGRVWLNMPYGRDTNGPWIHKLVSEWESGRVEQACCITFACTSEKWFQPLLRFPQVFLYPRTNYLLPDGTMKRGVTKGSVVTFLPGRNWIIGNFCRHFGKFGAIKITEYP